MFVVRYPVDTGAGWVLFAAPETTTTVIGIDPRVGGKCPGAMVNDIGCVRSKRMQTHMLMARLFVMVQSNA